MLRRNKSASGEGLDAPQARDAALRLLGRREHSARELKSKLRVRGVEDAAAGEIVESLAESGWQSDDRYAEMLVRSRVGQGFGRLRVTAEMRVAGIADETIRATLETADIDWDEQVRRLWDRKFGTPAANSAERQKQYRYLLGRGFEPVQISRLLKHEEE